MSIHGVQVCHRGEGGGQKKAGSGLMPADFTVFEVISKRCRCLLKLTDNKSGVSLLNIAVVS